MNEMLTNTSQICRARKPYLDLRSNEALCTLFTDSMVELGEKVETHNPALETNLGPATDQGKRNTNAPDISESISHVDC